MMSYNEDKLKNATLRLTFWPQDPIAQRTQDLECIICIGTKRGRKKVFRSLLSLCGHFRIEHKGDYLAEVEFSKYIMAKYNETIRGSAI